MRKYSALALLLAAQTTQADDMFEVAKDTCWDLIKNEYPTKRIYLDAHDRIGYSGDVRYFMAGRCYEPACNDPFSWFVYQVRYIEGRKANVTCTMPDGGEPKLDRYNQSNSFMPPG